MPLSADVPLSQTSPAVVVELYWNLLQEYAEEKHSGCPPDYLVKLPSLQQVVNCSVIQRGHNGSANGAVIDVAGIAGRVLWGPVDLDNHNNVSPTARSKLFIYTRSKFPNVEEFTEHQNSWDSAFDSQLEPKLHRGGSPDQPLPTAVVFPRKCHVSNAVPERNAKPYRREVFYSNRWASHSISYGDAQASAHYTIMPTNANNDDRANGSPSSRDRIEIRVDLLPKGERKLRNINDRLSCTLNVRIMRGQHGEWVPWQPEPLVKEEIKREHPDDYIKRERHSRSRSPSGSRSQVRHRTQIIKAEPADYALSHRQHAIYRQNQARRLI